MDNSLYHSSMIISIIAFYIILSLPKQDVFIFLRKIESEALGRLLRMLPLFFILSLFILFFLVYFVSYIQMQRRRYELGIYLTLGMKRKKLFLILFKEDITNNLLALSIGLPLGVLISESISLITAKIVGLGIIAHRFSFSLMAVCITVLGFMAVKWLVFAILTIKMIHQEIGQFLISQNEGNKSLKSSPLHLMSTFGGLFCLTVAYRYGMTGKAWKGTVNMGLTILLGITGTVLLFFGLRQGISVFIKIKKSKGLFVYNFRQIQEFVIQRSTIMAICSLLVFSALVLFGAGVAISTNNIFDQTHILDYTFKDEHGNNEKKFSRSEIEEILEREGLASDFSELIEIQVGMPKRRDAISFSNIVDAMKSSDKNEKREILIENLEPVKDCYIISLSGYNELRRAAHQKPIDLKSGEACLYMDKGFLMDQDFINSILKTNPAVDILGNHLKIVGEVETLPIVTDREISISVGLVLPDDVFREYIGKTPKSYISGILEPEKVKEKGLMGAILETNKKLEKTELKFESYIQNRGRQLFFIVSASYITIYLAIILLVVSNTIIGVLFLMAQRKSRRRYQTLIYLGASYPDLCESCKQQIHWHFGLPIGVALLNSIFGVASLFTGIIPSSIRVQMPQKMAIAILIILLLFIFELIYIVIVRKNSMQYLWQIMQSKRIE